MHTCCDLTELVVQANYPAVEQQWLALQWRLHEAESRLPREESRLSDRSDNTSTTGEASAANVGGAAATPSPGGPPASDGTAGGRYFGSGSAAAARVWRAGMAAVKARMGAAESGGAAQVCRARTASQHAGACQQPCLSKPCCGSLTCIALLQPNFER